MMKYAPSEFVEYKTYLLLHPHKDFNLYSKFENGVSTGGKISTVKIMAYAGIILLLITCINFVNLMLSQTTKSVKKLLFIWCTVFQDGDCFYVIF